jgi:hypothetical protein
MSGTLLELNAADGLMVQENQVKFKDRAQVLTVEQACNGCKFTAGRSFSQCDCRAQSRT